MLKFGMEVLYKQTGSTNQLASLQELLWLDIKYFIWPYLSHFKSDFDSVKRKIGITQFIQSKYLPGYSQANIPEMPWLAMICLVISQQFQV